MDSPLNSRDRLPLRAVVRYVGYMGWWWHVEDAHGQLVGFTGRPMTDITEPDGVALRGRAMTRRGAKSEAERALRQAERFFPPEGGWRPNRFIKNDGAGWTQAESQASGRDGRA